MKTLCVAFCALCCMLVATSASAEEFSAGLAAHYYKDATNWNGLWPDDTDTPLADPKACTFTEFKYTRVEPVVNHLFVRSGWFSVRWVGYIDVPGAGDAKTFLFETWADDGCRLQIDDKVLINSWYACPENIPAAHRTATATLTPGRHRIVIEYFQGQSLEALDSDPIKLYWQCAALGIAKQVVPEDRLSHKEADKGTPDAWEIKPPQTVVQLATSMLTDAQTAEENKDYAYALRLYRRILLIAPDTDAAKTAKERILAIESDPTIGDK
jgi:PA14 domain-containing protein